jgi:Integrase core domain
VERFQQTLKNWLAAQAPQPATLAQLQALLDAFTSYYNTRRPHKSLPGRATPAAAYAARPKAAPGDRSADTHDRVRTDKTGSTGTVTLRHGGKLYHIGIGRAHAGTEILLLVQDLHIRIVAAATGELLRELTLNPNRNYQPTGRPPGPNQEHRDPAWVHGVLDVLRDHNAPREGFEPSAYCLGGSRSIH